jgi:thioesterase domain-containing protein/acyl carrier protein
VSARPAGVPEASQPAGRIARDQLALSSPMVAPRSLLERRLAEIWQDALQVVPLGVEDDYYELGGGSLQGMEIFLRMEQEFGVKLPLAALVEQPTVARIAALIAAAGGGAWRCLVALKPGGTRPPLFCVHDSSGNLLVYRRLVDHLDRDQPLYGLQYPGQDRSPLKVLSIAALATQFAAEIRRAEPQGPYYLAGFSVGGVIAFEVARQLLAAGRRVAFLALLDSFAPGYPSQGLAKLRDHLLELGRRPPWTWPGYLRRRAGYRLARTAEHKHLYDGGRSTLYQIERKIMPQARATYVPRVYPGAVELFRCAEDRMLWRHTPELGWSGLAAGGITVHDIPTTHQNLLAEPAVALLAQRLTTCLATAHSRARDFAEPARKVAIAGATSSTYPLEAPQPGP